MGYPELMSKASLSGCQSWGPRTGVLRSHLPSTPRPVPCRHTVGTGVGSCAGPFLLCFSSYTGGWVTSRKAVLGRGNRDAMEEKTVPRLLWSTDGTQVGSLGTVLALSWLSASAAPKPTEPVGVAVPW